MAKAFDGKGWEQGLAKLAGPMKESLARRMAVAGGRIIRDEAKRIAWIEDNKDFEERTGMLAEAIYLAAERKKIVEGEYTYHISWNSRFAPHGHLIEFGHWRPYGAYFNPKTMNWVTRKDIKLPGQGEWVAARPFLRPAYDGRIQAAYREMISTGRAELTKLIGEM